jgi:hypothetical protein
MPALVLLIFRKALLLGVHARECTAPARAMSRYFFAVIPSLSRDPGECQSATWSDPAAIDRRSPGSLDKLGMTGIIPTRSCSAVCSRCRSRRGLPL